MRVKSSNALMLSRLFLVSIATVLGGTAGAAYGALFIFPGPGLSDPPLSFSWVVLGNGITHGFQALLASLSAVVAGVSARRRSTRLIAEVVAVLVGSFVGLLAGGYLTFSFMVAPNWIALVVVAIFVTLIYFGVTRLAKLGSRSSVSA